MFANLGITEIIIIIAVLLLLFGGRRIPQLARDVGTGIRELRNSLMGIEKQKEDEDLHEQEKNTSTTKRKTKRKTSKES